MPSQLRLVALAAAVSGLVTAAAVFADDRWGILAHHGRPVSVPRA
jgi:hypothetical protein